MSQTTEAAPNMACLCCFFIWYIVPLRDFNLPEAVTPACRRTVVLHYWMYQVSVEPVSDLFGGRMPVASARRAHAASGNV